MIGQYGNLVILVRDFRTNVELNPGTYFGLKVGNHCIRFNQVRGELIFPIDAGAPELPIELFLIQRRLKVNSVIGRRRDLLDQCELYYTKLPVTESHESCLEWRSLELKLAKAKMAFLVDIEFYPAVPLLPSKDSGMNSSCDSEQSTLECEEDDIKKETFKTSSSLPPTKSISEQKTSKTGGNRNKGASRRKRDRIKAILVGAPKDRVSDRVNFSVADANTVYYDLQSFSNVNNSQNDYKHGESLSTNHQVPLEATEISSLVNKQCEGIEDEMLPLDIAPQDYFSNFENRVKHNQQMNFTNSFSSDNIRLTGYLGRGEWGEPLLSCSMLNWYLRPGVNSIPGPPLPPKCPQGMLWEEHYLLNYEVYSRTVLR